MKSRPIVTPVLISAHVARPPAALAQDKGSVDPKPLPPLDHPKDPKLAAKELFARKLLPAAMPTRSSSRAASARAAVPVRPR